MTTSDQRDELDGIKTVGDAVEITEPWASAFKEAGLVSPVTDEPSIQALSRESGVHPSAISRIIGGRTRKPRSSTILKISKALEREFVEVAGWVGLSWQGHQEWTPPAESALLTPRQRDLLEDFIRELVRSHPDKSALGDD